MNNPDFVEQENLQEKSQQRISLKAFSRLFIVVLILIATGFGLKYYLENPGVINTAPEDEKPVVEYQGQPSDPVTAPTGDIKPAFAPLSKSTYKSYPIVKDEKLVLVPLDSGTKPFTYSVGKINWGSGASGKGVSEPQAAPDMEKIAYLDEKSHLHLLSADGKSDVLVSDKINVLYITGWSPDSNKLIVYAEADTLMNRLIPEGDVMYNELPKTMDFAKNQTAGGFYLIDVRNQAVSHLAPLEGMEVHDKWIDENSILVNFGRQLNNYLVFDVDAYRADDSLIPEAVEKDFGTQKSFSADGSKWAFVWHGGTGKTDTASIILADFPKAEGKVLKEAAFAYIQWPVISPDGQKVIFMEDEVINGPHFVNLYDGKETKILFEGIPLEWVDNERFLYSVMDPVGSSNPQHIAKVFLYDLKTGQPKQIY